MRLIVSYADPMKGHLGSIYQAGNWVFCGTGGSGEEYRTKEGKRIHSRLVGKNGIKNVFGKLVKGYDPQKIQRVKLEKKYKYLMPLDKEM
jgi:hypothetical protein